MSRARFISIEGTEGVGKSTARAFIEAWLQQHHLNYIVTREPGGTPVAEAIRSILLADHSENLTDETELLLMFASRSQNVKQVILPALAAGQWVLADRFTDASLAYQGGGRGMDIQAINQLAQLVQGDLQPDLTLLLDAPVEVGVQRVKQRGQQDRIEQENLDFFDRVRQQYLTLAKQQPDRFRVIRADLSIAEVEQQIATVLAEFLKQVQQ